MTVSQLPAFPDEVVTQVHSQRIDLPGGAGAALLLTLDNGHDHRKPTTLGPAGLANLEAAIDAATKLGASGDIAAILVTGKPFIFTVGADLKVVALGGSREQAMALAQAGHRIFRKFKDAPVPTFAFINGVAFGGGVELALHCHYRTLSAAVPTLALPECFLGLVPGWGGTQLLPQLVGIDSAVRVIIENPLANNATLSAKTAHELGLADVLLHPADFLEQSIAWAAQVLTGERAIRRAEHPKDQSTWDAAIARGRAVADAKTHGLSLAPYRALDLLELARTADFTAGTAAEDEALADLVTGDQLRASLYAFDLVQRRAKRPAGAPDASPRAVTKVGILGAGLMASQLALLFARRLLVPVVLIDLDQDRVDKGLAAVHSGIDGLAAKGRISPDVVGRLRGLITGSTSHQVLSDADFVLEAVYEDMAVKQELLAAIESVVAPNATLATNTSSLSVSTMATALHHPERLVGFHFFNPVAVLPLLEVVRGDATDDETLATALATGRALKKSCVLVKDAPAFVFNRLMCRMMTEVLEAIDGGTPPNVADDALWDLGLPMSPLSLLELVGPAVALHTVESLHAAFPDRFPVSKNLQALVATGHRRLLTTDQAGRPALDPEVAQLWASVRPNDDDRPALDGPGLLERTRGALAEEVGLMLAERVVAGPPEIDLCLLLGGGWAFRNGGLVPYLDRTGTSERVLGRRLLPPGIADASTAA